MAVSLTTRLGLHRWSADTDPWSRSEFDDDNAKLEDAVLIALQGLNASRPAPGVQRRLYTAADSERVYIDDGDEWYEFGMLGTANTWLLAQRFAAAIDAPGGIASSVGALSLPDDVAVGGNLSIAGTLSVGGNFDGGGITTLTNPFAPASGLTIQSSLLRKWGRNVEMIISSPNNPGAGGNFAEFTNPGGATDAAWMPAAGVIGGGALHVVGAVTAPGGTESFVPFGALNTYSQNILRVSSAGNVTMTGSNSSTTGGYALVWRGSWLTA